MIANLPRYVDYTILDPFLPAYAITEEVKKAISLNAAAVVLYPDIAEGIADQFKTKGLGNTNLCAVVNFPSGLGVIRAVLATIDSLREKPVQELDICVPPFWFRGIKAGQPTPAEVNERSANIIKSLVNRARPCTVKIIAETHKLNDSELELVCNIVKSSGADFVKTSSGFFGGNATPEEVRRAKKFAGSLKIKAAGGIRTYDQATSLIEAGADRLGTSATESILKEWNGGSRGNGLDPTAVWTV